MLNALRPEAGTSIAVFGTGTVGLAAVMAARVAGCTKIIGIDVRPARLARAEEFGATVMIDGRAVDAVVAREALGSCWRHVAGGPRTGVSGHTDQVAGTRRLLSG